MNQLLEILCEGQSIERELWEAKRKVVQEQLELDEEHLFRTKPPFMDIVIGAIMLGKQLGIRYSKQDPFHCSNDRDIIHDKNNKSGHTIDFSLEVALSNQIILTLCPLHPLTRVSTTHEEIVNLRQSLDG